MTAPDETTGRDDEIDELVRSALGEIPADRFDELIAGALSQEQIEAATHPEPGGGEVVELGASRPRARGRAASPNAARWLGMAAALAIGVLAVAVLAGRGSDGGGDLAAQSTRPATTTDRPLTTPPATLPPVAAGVGRCVPSLAPGPSTVPGAGLRRFTCAVQATAPTQPLGLRTVLFSDDSATLDLVAEPGGDVCVDPRPAPGAVRIEPGDCTGRGMRASAAEPGTYQLVYDLRSCNSAGACGSTPLATVRLELVVT